MRLSSDLQAIFDSYTFNSKERKALFDYYDEVIITLGQELTNPDQDADWSNANRHYEALPKKAKQFVDEQIGYTQAWHYGTEDLIEMASALFWQLSFMERK